MKKSIMCLALVSFFVSCASYTEEQGKAADFMCECLSKETDDLEILRFECNDEVESKFDKTVFIDEGYSNALEEKCPD